MTVFKITSDAKKKLPLRYGCDARNRAGGQELSRTLLLSRSLHDLVKLLAKCGGFVRNRRPAARPWLVSRSLTMLIRFEPAQGKASVVTSERIESYKVPVNRGTNAFVAQLVRAPV